MQVQNFSVAGTQPVSVLNENPVRLSSNGGAALNESRVGGMQTNAVPASSKLERQNALSTNDVDQAVQKINDTLQTLSQKLEFSVDKETDAFVVKVVDKETKEVIRQIPSEEMLNLAKALDKLQGLIIKDRV